MTVGNASYFLVVFLANIDEFVEAAVQSNRLSHDLQFQQRLFGPALKKPLPMDEKGHCHFHCGPMLGSMESLNRTLFPSVTTGNSQDNKIIAICQISGAGKTQRAWALAAKHHVILLRTLPDSAVKGCLLDGTLPLSLLFSLLFLLLSR